MTSPSTPTKQCPASICADPCEPVAASIAVSVRNRVKTKSTATRSHKPAKSKYTPIPGKLFGRVKNLIRKKKPPSEVCSAQVSHEVPLCDVLAFIGAIVIAWVVFRSLYLMYCKPDEL